MEMTLQKNVKNVMTIVMNALEKLLLNALYVCKIMFIMNLKINALNNVLKVIFQISLINYVKTVLDAILAY